MGRFSQLAMGMKLLIAVIPSKHVILSANETKARQGLDMDYSKHAKSSVGGEHDPGYGQASETWTDDQREFEKSTLPRIQNGSDPINPSPGTAAHNAMTREVDAEIQEMSDQQVKAGQETAKDADTITLIHRQASTIKRKFKRAKKMKREEQKKKKKPRAEEEAACQEAGQEGKTRQEEEGCQEEEKEGTRLRMNSGPSSVSHGPMVSVISCQFVCCTHSVKLEACIVANRAPSQNQQLGTFKSALHEWNYTPLSDKGVTKGMKGRIQKD